MNSERNHPDPHDDATERRYYLVRAMSQSEKDFSVFFEKGVVAVGWSDFPFRDFQNKNTEDLIKKVREGYDESYLRDAPQYLSKKMNEIRRFFGMRTGDRIVVPYWGSIRLATVADDELLYDDKEYDTDLANQRRVKYVLGADGFLTLPRNQLSEGLSRRLRVRGTGVGDLTEFGEEIEVLFRGESGWSSRLQTKIDKLSADFKRQLLDNIRNGKTNLEAGGDGLEKLVRELLEIEGYHARILPKTAFQGIADADIDASKADKVTEVKLLVQVKHHSGVSDLWGTIQLLKARQQREYAGHRLVLVTTANASRDLDEECNKQDIVLIDGKELASWIYALVGKISTDTRNKLGISDVPALAV